MDGFEKHARGSSRPSQAIFVTGKDFLHSHRHFQPGELPLFAQTAVEPNRGLHLLPGFWPEEILGGEWDQHAYHLLSLQGMPGLASSSVCWVHVNVIW